MIKTVDNDVNPIDVLIFGSIFYEGHQLTDQRVARALHAAGVRILYVDPGTNVMVSGRAQTQSKPRHDLRAVLADGVEVLSPKILPLGRRKLLYSFSYIAIAAQVRWELRKQLATSTKVLFFVSNPILIFLFRQWRCVVVVKDDYAAGSSLIGRKKTLLVNRRRRCLNRADAIVAVSTGLRSMLRTQGFESTLIPPGTELPNGSAPLASQRHARQRPIAVFNGMISDRIDFRFFEWVLAAGWDLQLIGGVQPTLTKKSAFSQLCEHPNVRYMGWMAHQEMFAVAQAADVGVVPYEVSDFNNLSSPLKILEYLACGLAVITTPIRAALELAAPGVLACSDGPAVADALRHIVADLDSDEGRSDRLVFAKANSWTDRVNQYLSVLEES